MRELKRILVKSQRLGKLVFVKSSPKLTILQVHLEIPTMRTTLFLFWTLAFSFLKLSSPIFYMTKGFSHLQIWNINLSYQIDIY